MSAAGLLHDTVWVQKCIELKSNAKKTRTRARQVHTKNGTGEYSP